MSRTRLVEVFGYHYLPHVLVEWLRAANTIFKMAALAQSDKMKGDDLQVSIRSVYFE